MSITLYRYVVDREERFRVDLENDLDPERGRRISLRSGDETHFASQLRYISTPGGFPTALVDGIVRAATQIDRLLEQMGLIERCEYRISDASVLHLRLPASQTQLYFELENVIEKTFFDESWKASSKRWPHRITGRWMGA